MKIIFSSVFSKWLKSLRDPVAHRSVLNRLALLQHGQPGDVKSIRGVQFPIIELRIHCSAGYRVYACRKGEEIIIILCAGSKDSQKKDIERAEKICKEFFND